MARKKVNKYNIGGILTAIGTAYSALEPIFTSGIKGLGVSKQKEQAMAIGNTELNPKSNIDLLNAWQNRNYLENQKASDITGSKVTDYIQSGKTIKNLEELNNVIDVANARQDKMLNDASFNIQRNQINNMMANYAAFGGPLFSMPITGAISYDIAKDNAYAKQLQAQGKDSTSTGSVLGAINTFADGGGIHIAPSKKGTFTAAAKKHGKSVQAFASQVLANKENYSPAMVKKANFARNAAKWHADGGLLMSDWFNNGVTLINQGGTHENNPHEGVQMGIAPDGAPNLVEEGEAIFKDYVFSNRLKVPKEVRNKYKLRGPKDMTFAEAFREAQKESAERPNDPISKDGLEHIAMILARTQEAVREYNNATSSHKAALGGYKYDGESPTYDWTSFLRNALINNENYLASNNATYLPYRRGLTMEQVRKDIEGANGYSDFTDFVYNNWDNPEVQAYLRQLDSLTGKNSNELGRDFFRQMRTDGKEGYYHITPGLGGASPLVPLTAPVKVEALPIDPVEIEKFNFNEDAPLNVELMKTPKRRRGSSDTSGDNGDIMGTNPLRYADIFANLGAVTRDILGVTNTPTRFNYIPSFQAISYDPIGNYVPVTHFDTRYAANQAAQQSAATRNAIMQSSSPSRNAALLANDYNAQIVNGELLRQAALDDYNMMVNRETFNRGTNQYNSEAGLKTAIANQEARLNYANSALRQAQLNDQAETMAYMGRAQNLGNLAESIAGVGQETDYRNWIKWLANAGVFGTLPTQSACGGTIKRKKRKGLTY